MSSHQGLGLRALMRNASKTTARQIWSGLLQLAVIIVIARSYGAEASGYYTVSLLLPTMLSTVVALGLAPSNVYHLGGGRHSLREVWRTTFRLWVWLSVAGILIGVFVAWFQADKFFPGIPIPVLVVALGSFPMILLVAYVGSLFQGLQDFTTYNLCLTVQPAVTLLAVSACALFGMPAPWLVASYLLGSLIAGAVMLKMLTYRLRAEPAVPAAVYPVTTALAYGIRAHLGNIISFLNYRLVLFLVNYFLNPALAGIYAVAMQLAEKLWLFSQAISTALLPKLSADARHRPEQGRRVVAIVSRLTFAATLFFSLVAASVAGILIPLGFGNEFASAVPVFIVMLPGIVAGSVVRVLSSEFSARGRPELNLYMALMVLVVAVVLNLLLIPAMGVIGAAAATSIAYVANLGVRVAMFRKYTGLSALDMLLLRGDDVRAIHSLVARK